ncbi:probable nucleoredoxin 1 [Phtheirospermum japonicum]|uniref:Probable nucleoredoxin 1 n=1 Tax=Phtheirospermum japonicum TaxID=374723 RepID=A0A830CZH0_9LAMI|nr:probable nucleoredoxin 1 [Phtheirospermum japonicum]
MPMKITHPFHKDHAFTLLPGPAYAEGLFSCDACGEPGKGFSYHCKPCGVDLHVLCASMPLSVTRTCHMHELRLKFGLPYDDKSFYCDVCMGPGGSRHWLYRCGPCGFGAHLNCALGFQATGSSSTRSAPQPPQFVSNAAIGVPAGGPMSVPGYAENREAVLRMINMINNNNVAAQAMLASGGGYDAYRLLRQQRLMQMISNFRNSGVGGGGGGIPGFNGMDGGAGGQDFLQALISGGSGGGGGGLDLQSLLGGGNGFDFLGGALGGFGL